jgi:uracil-DNA glycosylase family 4
MAKMRKSSYTYTNGYMDYEAKVFVTFHPSYLLRSPGQKKLVWEDMLKLQMLMEELS